MKLPVINAYTPDRRTLSVFLGYDHTLRCAEGEFYEMKNLTSDHFPVLSPRNPRSVMLNGITAMTVNRFLVTIRSRILYIGETPIEGMTLTAGEKTLVNFGAYVLIFPDAKYVNVNSVDTSDPEYGDIGATEVVTGYTDIYNVHLDGTPLTLKYIQSAEPESPTNGDLWADDSVSPPIIRRYDLSSWVLYDDHAVKITNYYTDFSSFREGDRITLSGIKEEYPDSPVAVLDGSHTVISGDGDNLIISGAYAGSGFTDPFNNLHLTRSIPQMDFVFESGNRLWGCRFGDNGDGKIVNEIYASKLGDFRNFNTFDGISTDSYVASCGTQGAFTGAISYQGYPMFFKETCVHKVYGSFPANYQIVTTEIPGVEAGSGGSLAVESGLLYYKSPRGVCVYDGSFPAVISDVLGDTPYGQAVAGAYGGKYYISMAKGEEYRLFVYDAGKRLWHVEDSTKATSLITMNNALLMLSDGVIYQIMRESTPGEKVEWYAQSGIIDTLSPNHKLISRLIIRLTLSPGSDVSFGIRYDSSGDWEKSCSFGTAALKSYDVQLRLQRCDHYELMISGHGEAKIYSITKEFTEGSDRR